MADPEYMKKHNINEHLIIFSLNELTGGNFYQAVLIRLGILDSSVIMMN